MSDATLPIRTNTRQLQQQLRQAKDLIRRLPYPRAQAAALELSGLLNTGLRVVGQHWRGDALTVDLGVRGLKAWIARTRRHQHLATSPRVRARRRSR